MKITDAEQAHDVVTRLRDCEVVGFDLETTGLSPRGNEIRLLQLSDGKDAWYADLFEDPDISWAHELLEDENVEKVAHNSAFDFSFLYHHYGIEVYPLYDTMLAVQLLGDWQANLAAAAKKYLDITLDKTEQASDWTGALSQEQIDYALRDAKVLPDLREATYRVIEKRKMVEVFDLEMDVVPAKAKMELYGVKIDKRQIKALDRKLKKQRRDAELEFETHFEDTRSQEVLFGDPTPMFNLNSSPQMKQAFSRLGIELASTDAGHISKLKHPAASTLLRYRAASKRISGFTEPYPKLPSEDGRIHSNFKQLHTATGRFSSSSPNLQNVPAEQEFRSCFVAEEGNVILTADYEQVELRILAEMSGDKNLLAAFTEGRDLHSNTASIMLGIQLDEVTKEQRTRGKTLNFGTVYGRGAKSLAGDLGVSEREAEKILRDYFASYPAVQPWIKKRGEEGERRGYVRTLSGRMAWLSGVNKSAVKREAVNYSIQGSSADITKLALVNVQEALRDLDAGVINCVHDELVVESPQEISEQVKKTVRDYMIQAGEHYLSTVPVEVEINIGDRWQK